MTYVDDRGNYNASYEWWLAWCYTWAWIGMIAETEGVRAYQARYGFGKWSQ